MVQARIHQHLNTFSSWLRLATRMLGTTLSMQEPLRSHP
jgi:hypothetical protein